MRLEMEEPQGWRGMTREFDARWILLVLCSLGGAGCAVDTTLVPGDPSHFDPVVAFPKVADYAGSSKTFQALLAAYVREDGTIDLKAKYIDVDDVHVVDYVFVEWGPRSPDADFPIGARGPEAPQGKSMFVSITRSRLTHEDGSYFQGGMRRWVGEPSWTRLLPKDVHPWKYSHGPMPAPRCPFAQLWAVARQRGAPAGAVAVIVYDPTGYYFRIDGNPFKLNFDANCTVKN